MCQLYFPHIYIYIIFFISKIYICCVGQSQGEPELAQINTQERKAGVRFSNTSQLACKCCSVEEKEEEQQQQQQQQ